MRVKKRDIYQAVPCLVPYLFLAMWLGWQKENLTWLAGILAVLPVCAIAWWHGRQARPAVFGVGCFLNFYVNQACLFMVGRQLPEEAADSWNARFAPSSAEASFLEWYLILLAVQVFIFLLARRSGQKEKKAS